MNFQAVQSLRAVAALMVLLMHARIAVWWAKDLWNIPFISAHGMTGVSLFFCISGFIIAHVVAKPNFEPMNFLIKRAWRIVPIYWLVTTLALLFWYTSRFWKADVERLGPIGILKSYIIFPQQGFPLVNPGWSLEHEVIFYLLAAILIPVLRLPGLFISLIAFWILGRLYSDWDYHILSYSQIYFAAGILAYWVRKVSPSILGPVALTTLSIMIANMYNYISLNTSLALIITAIAYSSLIATLVSLEYKGMTFPRWLVIIGDASYSIYIIHWIALPWIGVMAYKLGGSLEGWRWATFGICIILGLLSRRFIEIPLLRVKITWPRPNTSHVIRD